MHAWGRLLRLSLAPSAMADIACGVVLGAGAWPGGFGPFALILASLCVYHGGMALNDWADRAEDARLRPDRPIPSGTIKARTALLVALALLTVGPLIAWRAYPSSSTALVLLAASVAAALYDVAGRGPWRGPLLLASCRLLNLQAGLVAGRAALAGGNEPESSTVFSALALLPFLYAAYVFVVSRLGRLEDAEDDLELDNTPSTLLGMAAALLAAVPVPGLVDRASERPLAGALSGGIALAGAYGLGRAALRRSPWTRGDVLRSMGLALRRLIVFTAAAAALAPAPAGPTVAVVILCGFPLSFALRRVFPPS